jgi:hypothetical protein
MALAFVEKALDDSPGIQDVMGAMAQPGPPPGASRE